MPIKIWITTLMKAFSFVATTSWCKNASYLELTLFGRSLQWGVVTWTLHEKYSLTRIENVRIETHESSSQGIAFDSIDIVFFTIENGLYVTKVFELKLRHMVLIVRLLCVRLLSITSIELWWRKWKMDQLTETPQCSCPACHFNLRPRVCVEVQHSTTTKSCGLSF